MIIDNWLLPAGVSRADVEFVATRRPGLVKANPGHRRLIRGHDESGHHLELDLWENRGTLTLVSATLLAEMSSTPAETAPEQHL